MINHESIPIRAEALKAREETTRKYRSDAGRSLAAEGGLGARVQSMTPRHLEVPGITLKQDTTAP